MGDDMNIKFSVEEAAQFEMFQRQYNWINGERLKLRRAKRRGSVQSARIAELELRCRQLGREFQQFAERIS